MKPFQRIVIVVTALLSMAVGNHGHATERLYNGWPCTEITPLDQNHDELTSGKTFLLAQAYHEGKCVEQDYAIAYKLYRRAVDSDASLAAARLGMLYLNGHGVKRDEEKARYWFRNEVLETLHSPKSENQERYLDYVLFGQPMPEIMRQEIERGRREFKGPVDVLLRNYRDMMTGNGVHPNRKRALTWLVKARTKDKTGEASYLYAQRYLTGDRVLGEATMDQYESTLHSAARRNYAPAQEELGAYRLKIAKTEYEYQDALVWLLIAQRHGLDVTEAVEAAKQKLDRFYIDYASELAAEFEPLE